MPRATAAGQAGRRRRGGPHADPPPCTLRFCNQWTAAVSVLWLDEAGAEREYAQLEPGCSYGQGTFVSHAWRLRCAANGSLLAEHVAEGNATVTLRAEGSVAVQAGLHAPPPLAQQDPRWGAYRQRGAACGMPILAYDCVCQAAVCVAEGVIENMLRDADPAVLAAMRAHGAEVALIGRHQRTCDLPAYRHLRGLHSSNGGGTYDDATRGLGGHPGNPTTSCGEENVLMLAGDRYWAESILVHELAHAVMDLGLQGSPLREAIVAAYRAARRSGRFEAGSYLMSNECEYWAEASQAWFDATAREDVTSGMNTRDKVKARDPQLARLLARVYGDGAWRFAATAPRKLGVSRRRRGSSGAGGCAGGGSMQPMYPRRTRAAARFAGSSDTGVG